MKNVAWLLMLCLGIFVVGCSEPAVDETDDTTTEDTTTTDETKPADENEPADDTMPADDTTPADTEEPADDTQPAEGEGETEPAEGDTVEEVEIDSIDIGEPELPAEEDAAPAE